MENMNKSLPIIIANSQGYSRLPSEAGSLLGNADKSIFLISSKSNIDPELDRIKSINWYHITIIFFTALFLILQNTISLFSLFGKPKNQFSMTIITMIIGLCAVATFIQVILGRAFKIVTSPVNLTIKQQALRNNVELELQKMIKKDNNIYFITLVTANEYNLISGNDNFFYALKILAKDYQRDFCIIADNIDAVDDTTLSNLSKSDELYILDYSSQNMVGSKDSFLEAGRTSKNNHTWVSASPSLLRWAESWRYPKSDYYVTAISLLYHCFITAPNFILLTTLPFLSATLQGVSSLDEALKAVGIKNINGLRRLIIIVLGLFIGFCRSYTTYATKAPIAHQRASKIHHTILTCEKVRSDFSLCLLFTGNLEVFINSSIISKGYLIFGLVVGFATVAFYAGLGLFFSSTGLLYLLESIYPQCKATAKTSQCKSAMAIQVISILFAVATALLNGFYNQGWEAVVQFYKYAQPTTTAISVAGRKDKPSQLITKKNILFLVTILDSFAASVTAYNGGKKILEACGAPPSSTLSITLAVVIALSIFISQTCFSIELYKRDTGEEGNLWAKMFDVHCPTWIKKSCCQHTNAPLYRCTSDVDSAMIPLSSDFKSPLINESNAIMTNGAEAGEEKKIEETTMKEMKNRNLTHQDIGALNSSLS